MQKSKVFSAALILYLCFVAWVVLLSREPSDKAVIKLYSQTVLFFFGYYPDWQHDVTALHPEGMLIEDILNIILFVPIGFFTEAILLSKKIRNSLLWCTICGFICSLIIEVLQLLTRRGWFDVDDLLMNMLGAIAGGLFCLLLMWISQIINTKPEK